MLTADTGGATAVLVDELYVIRTLDLLPSPYMMVIYNMPDLSQVEGFEWDEGNSRKSVEKHDVSQAEAEQVFFNEPLLIVEDVSHSSMRSGCTLSDTPMRGGCFTSVSRCAATAS